MIQYREKGEDDEGEAEKKVIGKEQSQGINVGFNYTLVKQFSILVFHLLFTWA